MDIEIARPMVPLEQCLHVPNPSVVYERAVGAVVVDERRRIEAVAARDEVALTSAERTELAQLRKQVSVDRWVPRGSVGTTAVPNRCSRRSNTSATTVTPSFRTELVAAVDKWMSVTTIRGRAR